MGGQRYGHLVATPTTDSSIPRMTIFAIVQTMYFQNLCFWSFARLDRINPID
jgi:hypothetical protein